MRGCAFVSSPNPTVSVPIHRAGPYPALMLRALLERLIEPLEHVRFVSFIYFHSHTVLPHNVLRYSAPPASTALDQLRTVRGCAWRGTAWPDRAARRVRSWYSIQNRIWSASSRCSLIVISVSISLLGPSGLSVWLGTYYRHSFS